MRKVALVTGSSQGVGKGIAKKLLENNYIVYINGRNEEAVLNTVKEFNSPFAKYIIGDMNKESIIDETISSIIKNETAIDLVVANIGSGRSQIGIEANIQEYRRVFDINFFNTVALVNKTVQVMQNKGGNIIVISSIAGCESIGAPITYSSAKTALLSYAKGLSKVTAPLGIRVNCISPGNVLFKGSTWDKKIQIDKNNVDNYILQNVPLNTFATPEDIAKAVIFLEESSFMTGTNLVIDGGQINKLI